MDVTAKPDLIKSMFQKLSEIIQNIRNSPWTPTLPEFITFLIIVALFITLIMLFHYNSVQKQVKLNSRCYMDKNRGRIGGKYIVNATNKRNEPLYKVTYDLLAKQFTTECACTPGPTVNTFPNIRVYNMQTRTEEKIPEKYCQCNGQIFDPVEDRIYYNGYPGLTRFMYTGDTSFFDNAMVPT